MAHIDFLDETMRDGQQSLWGLRMRAGMALPVTPLIDRTGFSTIDLTGGGMLDVLTRYCQENYWEGLDLLVASMPNTPLRAGLRANANVTFGITPPALMDLWVQRLCAHGIRSFWIYDVLFGMDNMLRLARVAKEANGACVAGAIMFALSPVHTDAFFIANAKKLADSPHIDSILLYDTAGVLEKDRIQQLVPGLVQAAGGKPIEFHSNNLLGLSAKAYLDAIDCGVSVIHTASRPMANGPSVPSTEIMARNIQLRGHSHSLDESLFQPVADHFRAVGKASGNLVDQYAEYDEFSIQHQIPGGMMGTFKAQLAMHKMMDKLPEVLDEVAAVRRDLGYPGMATPFSQLVGIQAVLNVVTGKRYGTVPDEVIQYAAGFYGEPVAPVDADVLDRIMAAPRAKDLIAQPPEMPDLDTLKKRYGTQDEDELLYRAFVPQPDIDKMRAAGPVRRDYPLLSSPELEDVRKLMQVATLPVVELKSEGLSLSLRR
ncbi:MULTISPECIES: pyruvate carboxylase [unclassified Novosphingobium]|uniref:pyruvate carboxylase n=1 Tax=unclassified Novosphingobium TaxID=2644732 RepID=UPI001494BF8B|nr:MULTISPECIES: pyruvate carboxylase [unclassified Novosphingobium]MBB3359982.1 oxaloacetate decarboxylase alpha subunit [Novosphingobium sp. BK256]MBB3376341.1 oxaloacetate decarboxylase alpha subunit [Novosphingobium sp. BK280]MBB3380778.1 oxaloacetate decarboxylase alpha subunit [Novosphingobium sp. BK258]MBB3422406.1 oxaloacetate decarboxylase alpha subunit [Novosphingobium sp. BK267]MBB3451129.1 oxaloacetate decarboxylase alpha subunit [Novosphingobium sp. BK352]